MQKKFKVWDLEYKEWIAPLDFVNHLWQTNHKTKEIVLDDDVQESYKVLYFTGLKDKNGKEIYEGDVISCPKTHETKLFNHDRRAVVYYDGRSYLASTSDRRDLLGGFSSDKEVIGNIYENPDLI